MTAASFWLSSAMLAETWFVSFGTDDFRNLDLDLVDLEEMRMSLSAFSMGSAFDVPTHASRHRKTADIKREPRNFIRAKCANLMPYLV